MDGRGDHDALERQEEVDFFLATAEAGALYVNRMSGATTGAWRGYAPLNGKPLVSNSGLISFSWSSLIVGRLKYWGHAAA